jgi:pimeloyl-ACP methyl ester carboxylesterase
LRLRALLLSAALVLTGCTATSSPSPSQQIQDGADFYEQQISWSGCDVGFECATVVAPLDWLQDGEQLVSIALVRKSETENLTPMLVNPGGPGSSGVDYLVDGYETLGTSYLRSNFQLIGFDPRGVGKTSPVTCSEDEAKDRLLYEHVPHPFGSAEYLEYARLVGSEFAASCQAQEFSTAYFNTQQTARDMDLIRAVLGLETLNYLGFSYGTQLGASYAALFPDRVGLMVLDGAVDPTIDPSTKLVGQIKGFDKALEAYLIDCLKQSFCPFKGDVQSAKAQIANFLLARESSALPTFENRELSLQAAIAGIIVTLYSQQSWQFLSQAFSEAFQGNGSTFLLLADFYNDRDPEGGYLSNITEANYAISCSDDWLWPEVPDLSAEVMQASPVFGRYFASDDFGCEGWPQGIGMQKLDYTVPLANGPLIVGTTGDPATPYSQAVALSQLLDGATLLTLEGEGHTAYGSNECINELVDSFLSGKSVAGAESCKS